MGLTAKSDRWITHYALPPQQRPGVKLKREIRAPSSSREQNRHGANVRHENACALTPGVRLAVERGMN
jgi:hypothetical protein